MYIFAEPYEEDEIDAIQTGEYIQALRMAEARAKAEKQRNENTTMGDSGSSASENLDESKISGVSEEDNESDTTENEENEDSTDVGISQFPVRDLLAMVLKSQNYINGQQVSGSPTPTAEDRWEITYTFETYPPERGLRLYQMSQERRRKALDEEFREQVLEGSETAQKAKEWNRGFLKHLKDLSLRGKQWRDEFERTLGAKEKVIWKEGPSPSRFGSMTWREHQIKLETEEKDQSRKGT